MAKLVPNFEISSLQIKNCLGLIEYLTFLFVIFPNITFYILNLQQLKLRANTLFWQAFLHILFTSIKVVSVSHWFHVNVVVQPSVKRIVSRHLGKNRLMEQISLNIFYAHICKWRMSNADRKLVPQDTKGMVNYDEAQTAGMAKTRGDQLSHISGVLFDQWSMIRNQQLNSSGWYRKCAG